MSNNTLSNIYKPSYDIAPLPESRFIISENSTWTSCPAQCIIDPKLINPYKGGTRVELVSPFGKTPATCTVFYKANGEWCTCAPFYNASSSKYFGVVANCPGDGKVYISSGDYTVGGEKLLSPNPTNSGSIVNAEIVIMLTPANIAADGVITFQVGNIETLPSGNNATVKNSGKGGNIVLDFGIPKGDVGPRGENAVAGINPRGDYNIDASPSYVVNDYISYDGKTYVCKVDNSTNTAPTTGHNDDPFWQFIAIQGAEGPEGPPGPRGEQGLQGIPGDLVSGTAIAPTTRFLVSENTTWTRCPNQCIIAPKLLNPYPAKWRANLESPFGEVPAICTIFYKIGEKWVASIEGYNSTRTAYLGVIANCPGDGTVYVSSGDYLTAGDVGLAPNPTGSAPLTSCEIVIMLTPASSGILEVPSSGSAGGDSFYSLEERVVGTWVDGKPVYRKCFSNIAYNTKGALSTNISLADSDIRDMVRISGIRKTSSGVVISEGVKAYIYYDTAAKRLVGSIVGSSTVIAGVYTIILIEYTKNADYA